MFENLRVFIADRDGVYPIVVGLVDFGPLGGIHLSWGGYKDPLDSSFARCGGESAFVPVVIVDVIGVQECSEVEFGDAILSITGQIGVNKFVGFSILCFIDNVENGQHSMMLVLFIALEL